LDAEDLHDAGEGVQLVGETEDFQQAGFMR
jgi:hypothetical protein